MMILSKKLKAGELSGKVVVIIKGKKDMFPLPGVEFDLRDERTNYRVKLDRQYRLRLTDWFNNHPGVKAGDEIAFYRDDTGVRISLDNAPPSKTVSFKDLLGKNTREGTIVDIQQTPKGTVAIVQSVSEVPLDRILSELQLEQ